MADTTAAPAGRPAFASAAGPDRPDPPSAPPAYAVVIPTIGRPCLGACLQALAQGQGPAPLEVVVVDDRPDGPALDLPGWGLPLRVLRSGGRGPAAARNRGWRALSPAATWVAFLDDDVVPDPDWRQRLSQDLRDQPWLVAGSQGLVGVPRPQGRRPTDWERNVTGLEQARWATADLAYRRDVLEEVGGFDERFPRAFREDADLGLRVQAAGYLIVRGSRHITHPVRPADRWVSIRLQRGNADDVLMWGLHGYGWKEQAGAEGGRTGRHLLTTAGAAVALGALLTRRRALAAGAAATWLAGTAELAYVRLRPGPRTRSEIATMVSTTSVLPAAAVWHWLRGWTQLPALLADRTRAPLGLPRGPYPLARPKITRPAAQRPRPGQADPGWDVRAVLVDAVCLTVVDPDGRIRLLPGARVALRRALEEGLVVGVLVEPARAAGEAGQAGADAGHIDQLLVDVGLEVAVLGPPAHSQGEDPAWSRARLVKQAAQELGVDGSQCALVTAQAGWLQAAPGAGVRAVLVPRWDTPGPAVAAAPAVATDLLEAVDLVLARMV